MLGVSLHVFVQVIALLRAEDKRVLSTNKGYLLYDPECSAGRSRRAFHVCHTAEQVLDELTAIAELGGQVLDVSVEHELYGQIRVDLVIRTAQDAAEFAARLRASDGEPLNVLTGGEHYHTVEAPSEQLLDVIEAELNRRGYLIRD